MGDTATKKKCGTCGGRGVITVHDDKAYKNDEPEYREVPCEDCVPERLARAEKALRKIAELDANERECDDEGPWGDGCMDSGNNGDIRSHGWNMARQADAEIALEGLGE